MVIKIPYNYIRSIAAVMVILILAGFTGCGKVEKESGTDISKNDKSSITDDDGFVSVKDYIVTIQDEVKIRREPDDNADVYITLDKGVDLNRTGVKDDWTRILLNGSSFYVQSKYVEETAVNWATETDVEKVAHVIYLDPAKQITEDTSLEPVRPDEDNPDLTDSGNYATTTNAARAGMKSKMTASAVGVSSGTFEYEITMNVANYLNAELVKRGYTVFLSRTTNNVNLSNAKRVQMANACDTEAYIKLEAATAKDPTASGVLGFIATSTNPHSGNLYQKNYELCYDILRETCEETGAKRMGIYETDDLTSLNYCDSPATVINMGFLSNELDDMSLNTADYQKKLAVGIADGIDLYFKEIEK